MTGRVVRREVDLDGAWNVVGKVHGGYLLAAMVGAGLAVANPDRHPHPLGASAMYAASPAPGSASVVVEELAAGRTIASYRLVLEQDGRAMVHALLTAGRLVDDEPLFAGGRAADVAPLADCAVPTPPPGTHRMPAVLEFVDLRLDPATSGWMRGAPSGEGDIRGWLRMRLEGWDPLLAQFVLADTPPPATFGLGLYGWVPTLQLQVLLRRVPVAGSWQRVRQNAQLIGGNLLDEDCTLWDDAGRLTVQARQLAGYRP